MIYILILGALFIIGSYIPWGKMYEAYNEEETTVSTTRLEQCDESGVFSCPTNINKMGEPECMPMARKIHPQKHTYVEKVLHEQQRLRKESDKIMNTLSENAKALSRVIKEKKKRDESIR